MLEETIMPTNNELISDIPPLELKGGESKTLDIPAPGNGMPFFAGFEIPDGKKVFYLGKDIAGTNTLKLKFYNSESTPVTIKGFVRQ